MKYSIDEMVDAIKEMLPSETTGFKSQVEKILRKSWQHLEDKAQLQQTEPTTTDEAGHHSEWKYCPGCGFDWDIEMGADQFGCWNCGFIRKQQ